MGNSTETSRRRLLRSLGVGGLTGLVGCGQTRENQSQTSNTKPSEKQSDSEAPMDWEVDPLEHDKDIAARYYPWHSEGENWLQDSPGEPVLGEYNSRDEEVINQHIKWALEHGINRFAINWWGPGEFTDVTLRDHFLEAQLASEISFSIHYASPGPLSVNQTEIGNTIPMNSENRARLRADFRYLENNYFERENFFKVDGKPVVDLYNAVLFTGDIQGAVTDIRDEVEDVYLIADIVNWSPQFSDKHWIGAFDAITTYNFYTPGVGRQTDGEWDKVRSGTDKWYRWWRLAAEEEDVDFFPMTFPGYDDTEERPYRDHPVLERDPENFREFSQMAGKYIGSESDTISITTFNEWQEFTAVEPGKSYGEEYLNVIANTLVNEEIDHFDPSTYDNLTLNFDGAVRPEGGDSRKLAIMLGELSIHGGGEVLNYDIGNPEEEPIFTEGFFEPNRSDFDIGDYRWLGGPTDETHIRFARNEPVTEAVLYGDPFDSGVSADVYFNGERTDSVAFDSGLAEYSVALS